MCTTASAEPAWRALCETRASGRRLTEAACALNGFSPAAFELTIASVFATRIDRTSAWVVEAIAQDTA